MQDACVGLEAAGDDRAHELLPEIGERVLHPARRRQVGDADDASFIAPVWLSLPESDRNYAPLRLPRARRAAVRSTRLRDRRRAARTRRARRRGSGRRLRSTSVSSTCRSGMRRRVITGTARLVKTFSSSPQRAPHATLRPVRASASSAIFMRCSRVSSRNRWIRARRAAPFAVSSAAFGVVGLGQRAHDQDLFPVGRDRRGVGEPLVGKPAGEPAGQRVLVNRVVAFLDYIITCDQDASPGCPGLSK